MQRLSNVDGSFLMSETSTAHMHVVGTIVVDAAAMPGGYNFDHLKAMFAERLHLLPSFRRRVVEMPFGLDLPVWIEDPDFDLDHHLRRVAVPSPGNLHELAELVSDFASRPLTREKPLWEALLVEGLEDGHSAIVTKLHHAMMDGGAGAELLAVLFETSPEGSKLEAASEEWTPESVPSALQLLGGALLAQIRRPARIAGALTTVTRASLGALRRGRDRDGDQPALFSGPQTSFNRTLSAHRSVAYIRAELADFKDVAKAHGAKVNDVVMAACTSALRAYLSSRGELPDEPLVASVPVALRSDPNSGDGANHISMMLIPLPTHLGDPVERLLFLRDAALRAKRDHVQAGGDVVQRFTDFATAVMTPGILSSLVEALSASHIADRTAPLWNLVISNMVGPPVPIYCAGARIEAIYPLGPIVDGVGINITVMSDVNHMDVGIMACRDLVSDVEGLAEGIAKGVAELAATLDRPAAVGSPGAPSSG